MHLKLYFCVLFYVVLCVQSDNIVRMKRSKYFPGLFRLFQRPVRQDFQIYSNTPPPPQLNYMTAEDAFSNGPPPPEKFRISKPPENHLDVKQLTDIVNNLSKGDLNKIFDIANEKEKLENFNKLVNVNNNKIGNGIMKMYYQTPNYNINRFNYMMSNNNPNILYTTGQNTKEEVLPRPINLRNEFDYAVSFTNNVPTYAKPNYKLENFGALPLEDNKSMLASVSSYNVPHYSVISPPSSPKSTSNSSYGTSSSAVPDIEVAPSPTSSAARAESDAHLKAIKIWTHQSKGAAYYLHSDGTLSLEKPNTKY